MTSIEFIAEALAKLDQGRVEINGEWYYNQESVLATLEWLKQKMEDTEYKKVTEIIERIKNMIPQFTYFPPK